MKKYLLLLPLLSLIILSMGCNTLKINPGSSASDKDKHQVTDRAHALNLYTKYNIHVMRYGGDFKAHYTNWIGPFSGHTIIPVNTLVSIDYWPQGFILKRVDTGQQIYYYFNEQHMNMNIDQYINLITSSQKRSISGFSELDKKGIKSGNPFIGMTKQGILLALGYPAKHKTPSLKSRYWIYWKNKWLTVIIKFSSSGKVIDIVE